MPEGDTIYRAARTLHRALAGRVVIRFESMFPALTRVDEDAPLAGRTIESIRAAGKHLLMAFSGGLVLRTHMRMNGSWHIYRPGERWQRSRRDMRIVIATDAFEAVGFNIPIAEWLLSSGAPPGTQARSLAGTPAPRPDPSHPNGLWIARRGPRFEERRPRLVPLERQEDLRLMGPDLLGETFDADEAVRRMRAHRDLALADALLNQRIVAGIGNVYKSEVLFICRLDPFACVADVGDDRLRTALDTARRLLKANAAMASSAIVTYTGFRRTARRLQPSERLYVYGRARKPCRRCGTPIQVKAQGPQARLTYWCGRCQLQG